jgi:glycyl-tRNA synthetase beta chain
MAKNALLEIGTEEIPASYIAPALEQMKKNAAEMLNAVGLKFDAITTYSTPRRLILIINNVDEKSEDKNQEFNGPSVKAGKDANGNWTQAVLGFSKKHNINPEQLQIKETEKGQYYCHLQKIKGIKAEKALSDIFPEIIKKIFSKNYGLGKFAYEICKTRKDNSRHVRRQNDKIFNGKRRAFLVKKNNRSSYSYIKPIAIDSVDNYKMILKNNCVLADQAERKKE